MNYVILDLEWNQPKSKRRMIKSPVKLYGEIIQIGAVKVDENLQELDRFNVIIKPEFYREMNKHVSELTEITDDMIATGMPFGEAIGLFREWLDEDSILLTWGPDDIMYLEDNLLIHGMDTCWIPEDYDAQLIFDDVVTMEARQYALNYAMFKLNIKPLRCHDALNDAVNTLRVLQNLDFRRGIDEYYCA